jgi:hypothetical protein
MKDDTMIDMHGVLETVPVDGSKAIYVSPDRRYWPNVVSGDYCATIQGPHGEDEHWYDAEGRPLDAGSPAIRNRVPKVQRDLLQAAFVAGCAAMSKDSGFTEEALFDEWFEANRDRLLGTLA